jgi:hypothetical protein
MATTKVGGGVVNLNSDNTAFKMPVGSSPFTGTPVAGMIRNNTSVTNNDATTVFEYYDGTQWVGLGTVAFPKIDFLVIAGGGAGGSNPVTGAHGGGGGAGGYRTSYGTGNISGGNSPVELSYLPTLGTTYTITVGGAASQNTTANDSSIVGGTINLVSLRGGYGGDSYLNQAQDGGSGGGGSNGGNQRFEGSGTSGQGTDGGFGGVLNAGGGGGGAGETGFNSGPSNNFGGDGGSGLASLITGTSVIRAGGGGGAGAQTGGAGGAGGGGQGGSGGYGGSGTANTGGGGAGGTGYLQAGAGGSGVVILRMATSTYSGTTTGNPTVDQSSVPGTTILIFNGSGEYIH